MLGSLQPNKMRRLFKFYAQGLLSGAIDKFLTLTLTLMGGLLSGAIDKFNNPELLGLDEYILLLKESI